MRQQGYAFNGYKMWFIIVEVTFIANDDNGDDTNDDDTNDDDHYNFRSVNRK